LSHEALGKGWQDLVQPQGQWQLVQRGMINFSNKPGYGNQPVSRLFRLRSDFPMEGQQTAFPDFEEIGSGLFLGDFHIDQDPVK
jgi:hypothetical protein